MVLGTAIGLNGHRNQKGGWDMIKSTRKQIKYIVSSFAAVVFAVNC
jgi:hypothetical protein